MTKQELFDKAYRGLASQGFERSLSWRNNSWGCAYRGTENRRCAVGWCIPDEAYTDGIEGKNCFALEVRSLFPGMDFQWLADLQACHDGACDQETMRHRLEAFAANGGLTVPDITQGSV